jgi:hypothetical protein
LRQRYREGQEDQLGALGLVTNIVVLWNTIYIDAALSRVRCASAFTLSVSIPPTGTRATRRPPGAAGSRPSNCCCRSPRAWGTCDSTPAPRRGPAQEQKLAERILSERQVFALLEAVEDRPRDHALIRLLYNGGLRVSELVTLRWRNFVEGVANVTGKGGKTRVGRLSQGTWAELQALRTEETIGEDFVFPMSAVSAWKRVKRAARLAGISEVPVSPHSCAAPTAPTPCAVAPILRSCATRWDMRRLRRPAAICTLDPRSPVATTSRCDPGAFGELGASQLIYLVGLYSLVSMTLNGFDVPVPRAV